MKLTRNDLGETTINTSPISPSEFTISIKTKTGNEFELSSGDVVDAVKEYVIKYQKELWEEGKYYV